MGPRVGFGSVGWLGGQGWPARSGCGVGRRGSGGEVRREGSAARFGHVVGRRRLGGHGSGGTVRRPGLLDPRPVGSDRGVLGWLCVVRRRRDASRPESSGGRLDGTDPFAGRWWRGRFDDFGVVVWCSAGWLGCSDSCAGSDVAVRLGQRDSASATRAGHPGTGWTARIRVRALVALRSAKFWVVGRPVVGWMARTEYGFGCLWHGSERGGSACGPSDRRPGWLRSGYSSSACGGGWFGLWIIRRAVGWPDPRGRACGAVRRRAVRLVGGRCSWRGLGWVRLDWSVGMVQRAWFSGEPARPSIGGPVGARLVLVARFGWIARPIFYWHLWRRVRVEQFGVTAGWLGLARAWLGSGRGLCGWHLWDRHGVRWLGSVGRTRRSPVWVRIGDVSMRRHRVGVARGVWCPPNRRPTVRRARIAATLPGRWLVRGLASFGVVGFGPWWWPVSVRLLVLLLRCVVGPESGIGTGC